LVLTLAAVQAQGHLRNKLVVRPARLDSRFHQRIKAAVGDRQVKAAKVRTREDFANPELEKANQEKAIEERIKAEYAPRARSRILWCPENVTPYQHLATAMACTIRQVGVPESRADCGAQVWIPRKQSRLL
jgi:hypothetical protein